MVEEDEKIDSQGDDVEENEGNRTPPSSSLSSSTRSINAPRKQEAYDKFMRHLEPFLMMMSLTLSYLPMPIQLVLKRHLKRRSGEMQWIKS